MSAFDTAALSKGDLIWVDTAAFIASPTPTGHTVMCEVVVDSPEGSCDVYVSPYAPGFSCKTVLKSQMGVPDGYRHIKRR